MTKDHIAPHLQPLADIMNGAIPFNKHLGVRVACLTEGFCLLRLPWNDFLIGDPSRPSVHGGVLSTLIDTSGGVACWSLLKHPADRLSTVDLRVDYLRPCHDCDLLCEARVVRMGNRVGVARMELFADHGKNPRAPIATGQGVYNIAKATS